MASEVIMRRQPRPPEDRPNAATVVYVCPHPGCGVLGERELNGNGGFGIVTKRCRACQGLEVWISDDEMVYPAAFAAPEPDPALTGEVLDDYMEAAAVAPASSRAAAALLRLAIQRLCNGLLEREDLPLDAAIGELVKLGLPPRVQQALDVVRVVGNDAVHPGTLDLRDDAARVAVLFGLVNTVAEYMITMPAHVEELYEALPETKREQITRRDQSPA